MKFDVEGNGYPKTDYEARYVKVVNKISLIQCVGNR